MEITKELLEKLKSAKSVEEVLAKAKEEGVELEEEAAKEIHSKLGELKELAEDELDKVDGGLCVFAKINSKVNPKVDAKIDSKVNAKVNGKVNAKVNSKVSGKIKG